MFQVLPSGDFLGMPIKKPGARSNEASSMSGNEEGDQTNQLHRAHSLFADRRKREKAAKNVVEADDDY